MKKLGAGRVLTAGLILLAVFLALWILPSSEYLFLPDDAHPVAPLVNVQGGHDARGPGGIYFVDVIVRKASILERLLGGLHDGADLRPRNQVVPPGVNDAERRKIDLREMTRSQQVAAAVALRALGRRVRAVPTGALVTAVQPGRPADGKLRPGDVVVAVDGDAVRSTDHVRSRMAGHRAGRLVRFTVRRGGGLRDVTMRTERAGNGSARPVVGILLEPSYDIRLPIKVGIDAGNVGGPSAGVAFALQVMEELGRDVDHGHKIAATGEIFIDGAIGPVGGLKQKTIGARKTGVDAFLVPAGDNAAEARKYADGLRVIPVKTFPQALRALATLPS